MKLEPSDTPIRHHDDGPRGPRDDRRGPPPREFGAGRGWDRGRDRDRDRDLGGRDREFRDPRDRDFGRDREHGRDRRDDRRDFERDRHDRYRDEPPRLGHPKNDPERPTSLFIGNLDDATSDDDMFRLFGSVGKVRSVRLLNDRVTGRSRGCGFVDFERPEDAARGIILMDQVPDNTPDCGGWENYADLSKKKLWKD